ncbi:MAG: hypothetical protein DRN91_04765 [Candidatus Alkanophagales archaeon]|nr:MAG: hypothetical protein DRN91_04765 [Candidatus Alkanophagales archaeon]
MRKKEMTDKQKKRGRPWAGHIKMKPFNLLLTTEQKAWLKEESARTGLPMGAVLRGLIVKAMS